jgi:NTE family protein
VKKRNEKRPVVGLALGSGSARGWCHIGVIRELAELGIRPDIVCGTSIGSLVGGAYCSGNLDKLEQWVLTLDRKEVARYLDVNVLGSGGAIKGEKIIEFFRTKIGDPRFEDCETPFGTVATNLATGREVWLREGPILDAVRASISLPGLFAPIKMNGDWLVDGGLVNPVPVSLCHAMGADIVIAVNLNGGRLGHDLRAAEHPKEDASREPPTNALERVVADLQERADTFLSELFSSENDHPGLFDVLSASINIMQDRITRSRMAGDYPDIMMAPRLAHIGLMDYHRAAEAIDEGRAVVRRALPAMEGLLL